MTMTGTDPAEDIRRHLEDAGYSVERPRPAEPSLLRARHADRPALLVKVYAGAVRFTTAFRLDDAVSADRPRLLEAVNDLNRRSMGACACVNLRGELAIEAFLYAEYDRVTFDRFLRRVWDREMDRLAHEPAFAPLEEHEAPISHERH
jgi:hypothetical protein